MSNREIKFRAWDKQKRTMLGQMWPKMAINSDSTFGFPSDELYEIMQFTGLKDKNGKEIYEGDIVHYQYDYNGADNWEIVWGYDGWIMRRGDKQTGDENLQDDPHYNSWNEAVVIGNIYENPELLAPTSPSKAGEDLTSKL